jgi:hypothetical protein
MTARIVLAVVLVVVAALVAWLLERRRKPSAPTRDTATIPAQLDRRDFPRPDAPWLVVLWSSRTCESCQGLFEKIEPLASADVAVAEIEYQAETELHRRYGIDAAPITLIVDHEGVTRGSFAGSFGATDLWARLAEVRAEPRPTSSP